MVQKQWLETYQGKEKQVEELSKQNAALALQNNNLEAKVAELDNTNAQLEEKLSKA
jgi:hypothetical protein